MIELLSFSERLRAWRQRKKTRTVARSAATVGPNNLLPFRHHLDAGLEDPPNGAVPWLDWLRAEPWVPVVED
jgi:hypothetical protein